jgi:hypothetical protein
MPRELKTGIQILRHLNRETRTAFPGYNVLAKKTNLHRDTVRKAVHGRLKRFWHVQPRKQGKKYSSHLYTPLPAQAQVTDQPPVQVPAQSALRAECFNLARQKFGQDGATWVGKWLKGIRDDELPAVLEVIRNSDDIYHLENGLFIKFSRHPGVDR